MVPSRAPHGTTNPVTTLLASQAFLWNPGGSCYYLITHVLYAPAKPACRPHHGLLPAQVVPGPTWTTAVALGCFTSRTKGNTSPSSLQKASGKQSGPSRTLTWLEGQPQQPLNTFRVFHSLPSPLAHGSLLSALAKCYFQVSSYFLFLGGFNF